MNPVSVEAFDIFSQGEISECDSECGSVAVSGVPVVIDVGETASSVVTVMCEGVPSDSEWDFVEPQSFSFSEKRNFACVENQEDMNYEGTLVLGALCPKKKDEDAAATAEIFFDSGGRKPLECSRKSGHCKDEAVREQQ